MTQWMSSPTGRLPEDFRAGKTLSWGENTVLWCLLQDLYLASLSVVTDCVISSVLHFMAQAHKSLLPFYSEPYS